MFWKNFSVYLFISLSGSPLLLGLSVSSGVGGASPLLLWEHQQWDAREGSRDGICWMTCKIRFCYSPQRFPLLLLQQCSEYRMFGGVTCAGNKYTLFLWGIAIRVLLFGMCTSILSRAIAIIHSELLKMWEIHIHSCPKPPAVHWIIGGFGCWGSVRGQQCSTTPVSHCSGV